MHQFTASNVEMEMEVYGFDSVIKSSCHMCYGGCGVQSHSGLRSKNVLG